ncbi:MAG: SDR family oxidoreductase [Anaerolineaceae bacterium]|nr:SDR family oxidoreductase [Anaerolineaceae bacterium]
MNSVYRGRLALITGGSSGIGLELARLLAKDGTSLILLARDAQKLEAARQELSKETDVSGQKLAVYSCDVSDAESVQKAANDIILRFGTPDFIFNCAGVARPGYVEELPLEVYKWTMDIDYHGTVNVTKAFLNGMIARGSGHIINISSLAGVIGTFGYTAYSAAKFAVRGFSDTLRAELKPKGLKVSIVYPPDTDTPQLKWESQFKPAETAILAGSDKPLPARDVANTILKEAAKGKYAIIPGAQAKMMYWMATHLGGLVYKIMDMLVNNAIKKKSTRSTKK